MIFVCELKHQHRIALILLKFILFFFLAVATFISKYENLNIDEEEFSLLFAITLFHGGKRSTVFTMILINVSSNLLSVLCQLIYLDCW